MSSNPLVTQADSLHSFVDAVEIAGPLPLDKWSGKRSGPRRTLVVPVWVRPLSGPDCGSGRMCKLRDVTDWGVGLRSQVPYETGQNVWIELRVNNTTWSGAMQVVHSTQTLGGYIVGLVVAEHADAFRAAAAESCAEPATDVAADPTANLRHTLREREWLAQAKAEVREAIRAYQLARRSWGLLGVSVRREIRRIVQSLPGTVDVETDSRRKHPRTHTTADLQVVVCESETWRRIPARIADVSEDGVGLMLMQGPSQASEAESPTADLSVHRGMPMILGLGSEPNTLWVPAEIIHCRDVAENVTRIGAQFLTPRALAIFADTHSAGS